MCIMCKGTMEVGTSTFMVDVNNCIIAIRNVPTNICDQCGAKTYDNDISKNLENMVNKLKESKQEIAVVKYEDVAA